MAPSSMTDQRCGSLVGRWGLAEGQRGWCVCHLTACTTSSVSQPGLSETRRLVPREVLHWPVARRPPRSETQS